MSGREGEVVMERLQASFAALEPFGLGRPPHVSIGAHLTRLAACGLIPLETAERGVRLYHRARYGREASDDASVNAVAGELSASAERLAARSEADRQALRDAFLRLTEPPLPTLPRSQSHRANGQALAPRCTATIDSAPAIARAVAPSEPAPAAPRSRRRWRWPTGAARGQLIASALGLWSLGMIAIGFWQQPRIAHAWRELATSLQLHWSYSRMPRDPTYMARLRKEARDHPDSVEAWLNLKDAHFRRREYGECIAAYRHALARAPQDAELLNNFAWWLLVMVPDPLYRDPVQALELAERAYALKPTAYITDTLAEAAYQTGDFERAVLLETEALQKPLTDRATFETQLRKFLAAVEQKRIVAD